MSTLSQDHLRAIVASLEPAYPAEGCGLVLRAPDGTLRVHPCENIADALHADDPETFPRTSRTFYAISPREFLLADKRGDEVVMVYHSHCDVGDYFSDEDRAVATMGMGEDAGPAWPGRDYLVVSVIQGAAQRATNYRYDDATRRFEAAEVYALTPSAP